MSETFLTKVCKRCFESKPLEDFHKQPSGPMGRHSEFMGKALAYLSSTAGFHASRSRSQGAG